MNDDTTGFSRSFRLANGAPVFSTLSPKHFRVMHVEFFKRSGIAASRRPVPDEDPQNNDHHHPSNEEIPSRAAYIDAVSFLLSAVSSSYVGGNLANLSSKDAKKKNAKTHGARPEPKHATKPNSGLYIVEGAEDEASQETILSLHQRNSPSGIEQGGRLPNNTVGEAVVGGK